MQFHRFVLPAMLAVLAGCSSTQLAEPAAATSGAAAATNAARPSASAQSSATTVKTVTVHPLDDPKSPLAKRSVYFDFDSFVVRESEQPVVESHAGYLSKARTAKVRIEGNADERGGSEYNLALGQKRSEAVLKSLKLLGVPESELEATSFGKEKPVDLGHDEAAWAKNRRADLNYVSR